MMNEAVNCECGCPTNKNNSRSLDATSRGSTVQVVHVEAEDDEVRRFLESLGFVDGAEVSIINEICGNVIVNIKGARVAISKEMAKNVLVY